MFPIPREESVDIDEEFDFRMAEYLISRREKN
jgi:CMP-N-acetylneuraminic acid synthetase